MPLEKTMNISKFSELTKLSVHTLRYYEKLGLLSNISRNDSGRRIYTQEDIEWVTFISELKSIGMSLEQIKQYQALQAVGESTYQQRRTILESHRKALDERIRTEQSHLSVLDAKMQKCNKLKHLT
jgi:DNA-binding transcriptional MerR regulator